MNFQDLLLAHGAFYKHEKRAKFYDEYLKKKNDQKWASPELPDEEIDKLFKFIIRWDYHFRGNESKFKETYSEIFSHLMDLKDESFFTIDLSNEKNVSNIKIVFNSMANCNYEGRHESTDASKIIHAINPSLFVMWDSKIRKGIMGSANNQYVNYYISFLKKMKNEIQELIATCTESSDYSEEESLKIIEELCDGKTIAKLIDEYNYMTFTMSTEFSAYKGDIHPDILEKLIHQPLKQSIDLWKKQLYSDRYSKQGQLRYYIRLLDEAKNRELISAEEWRDYSSRWRKNPNDRDYLVSFFEEKLKL
ncbi:hypothetical protein KAU18_07505 [Candidatus Bathyarchaeota archaeon]|nr:hypothetical protein [Candidatus Bathyarchaeota archaeon]